MATSFVVVSTTAVVVLRPGHYWHHRNWLMPVLRILFYAMPSFRSTKAGTALVLEHSARPGWLGAADLLRNATESWTGNSTCARAPRPFRDPWRRLQLPLPRPTRARLPTPALDLQQVVQSALADLLSGAGALHHEDSWEEPTALAPLPAAPATRRPTDQHPPAAQPAAAAAAGAARNARPSEPSFSSTSYDGEAPLQEGDLPPAAAARLYAARLRAAQGDVEGLQAALKARDSKLGALEKEVQQLRAEKVAWQKSQRALEAQAERGKRAAEEARARLAEQENALRQVDAERRATQQERRQAEADVKAREGKLAAALEEAQRLRRALEEARGAAAARAGVSREDHVRVVAEARTLAGQKQELAVALKKAGRLIDVLRRQRVHLEAAALLQVSSRELADALAAQQ
ncbi:testis-expressed sequence 9 isoform X1 [Micractinium conductrix]|uniref:Testis-expressed sequence 9 isoform X1 n=1 Tax=Micractinium conductrix TaxID=554055 RepID=A0A2P6VF34_9CHLO|nr:testis-expressed sequence 9 isoform X1 [Micractinium conductrix]|eukprot:PSC72703.1 testis-expressed sequence 9 isoform X1 [Micractinium conductrix]